MSDMQIVRPRLQFEREFGQHRNWWVRDPRLVGRPLSVLLYLLSHDQDHQVTQTDAQRELGIGKTSWQDCKRTLMGAGFLIEIRDRYPRGYRDAQGVHRGGQKRWRLVLQDPEEGVEIDPAEAVIEVDYALESREETPDQSQCRNPAVASETTAGIRHWDEKPQVRASAGIRHTEPSSVDNSETTAGIRHTFIGREEGRLGRFNKNSFQPTDQTGRARETSPAEANPRPEPDPGVLLINDAAVDAELEVLAPGCGLTFAAVAAEVEGRVDLARVDVVAAARDTIGRAKQRVDDPARYVAAVIVRKPGAWPLGGNGTSPYEPKLPASPAAATRTPGCASGDHDWGPEKWGETLRDRCLDCDVHRADVDRVYAELVGDLTAFGGGL